MRITRRQLRRILKEFRDISHEEVVGYLKAQAQEYALDAALTPPAIQMLLMDDFMDNIGAYVDLSPEYRDLIDSLAGIPGASPMLEGFAATAEEEAKKINAQAGPNKFGMTLVTDQAVWESMGIYTGEELAISLLSQTYSDYYKEVHGIRPRWNMEKINAMTVEEIQAEIEQLDREAEEIATTDPDEWMEERFYDEQDYRDLEDTVVAAVKANPEDIPEEYLEYQVATQQGMGRRPAGSKAQRRMESKVKITRRQLRRIIREYGRSEHDAEASGMVASYRQGYSDGYENPRLQATTGRDPEYLRGYEKGAADAEDGRDEAKYIREAEGSTKKYDDDSALKGGQSKLPDGLQKGIIDKTVKDREEREEEEREETNESLRITRQQLQRIILEWTGDMSLFELGQEDAVGNIPPQDADPDYMMGYNEVLIDFGEVPVKPPKPGSGKPLDPAELKHAHVGGSRRFREGILLETEMLKIISNPNSPETEVFNRIANYALTNDIAGAMADEEVNTDELYWELDEMRPWVSYVGGDEQWMTDDAVVPDNWDMDAVYEFMGDLENAWHDDQAKKDHAAVAADPDKDWLEFMANEFTSVITPNDLETLGWKEYKRYIRLSPPSSLSHAMGEIHIANQDIEQHGPGTREEFVEFLTNRAGKTLKKRKIYRSPPPLYD